MKTRVIWIYKGINVFPAVPNSAGIRWYVVAGNLRADTKQGMRELITASLKTKGK